MHKAQISIEYFIVMGMVFITATVIVLIFISESVDSNDAVNIRQAKQITQSIANAADKVYYTGKNSKITIEANFPYNIEEATVGNKEINLKMDTKTGVDDVHEPTSAPVTGNLPQNSGLYHVIIKSDGDYVNISYK